MSSNDLAESRWAPRSGQTSSTNTSSITTNFRSLAAPSTSRAESLDRIRRLIERIEWKTGMLHMSRSYVDSMPGGSKMFKLDWFEWFQTLERVLLLLLAFYQVSLGDYSISTGQRHIIGDQRRTFTQQQLQQSRIIANHRYHASILEAFEHEQNPLREILGQGEIRKHLRDAKELRNRWKDAEEESSTESTPLPDLASIDYTLNAILQALKSSLELATEHLRMYGETNNVNRRFSAHQVLLTSDPDGDVIMEEVPYEVETDATMWY